MSAFGKDRDPARIFFILGSWKKSVPPPTFSILIISMLGCTFTKQMTHGTDCKNFLNCLPNHRRFNFDKNPDTVAWSGRWNDRLERFTIATRF